MLFDANGRRIPPAYLPANSVNFYSGSYRTDKFPKRPEKLQFDPRLERFINSIPENFQGIFNTSRTPKIPAPRDAQSAMFQLINRLDESPYRSLLNGTYLPILIMPRFSFFYLYIRAFTEVWLRALRNGFFATFGADSEFENQISLAQLVPRLINEEIFYSPEGRVEEMTKFISKPSQEKVTIALFFPYALHGFSLYAANAQINELPERFALAGAFETVTAFIMYGDILGRINTPALLTSGVYWQDLPQTLYIKPEITSLGLNKHKLTIGISDFESYKCGSNHFSSGLIYY